jgi:hypothetical protein
LTIDASSAGDDWGSQVVQSDATLSGDGTAGTPLGVVWGNVTQHTDVTDAGSGAIITVVERGNLHAPTSDNQNLFNRVSDGTNTYTVASQTDILNFTATGGAAVAVNPATGQVTIDASSAGDDWGSQVAQTTPRLDGDCTAGDPLDIAQQGATAGQALKWNGSAWAPAADAEGTGTVTSIATNNGITGGPITTSGTIGLTGQALALHNLGSNGIIARTGSGTVAARTITAGTGIGVTNGDGVSGNPTITNNGVTSLTASTGISLSGSTGAVTITNSAPWTSSSGDYIQNQSASAQAGNFRISSYASTNNLAPSSRYGFASQSTAGSSGTGWDASSIYAGVYGRVAGSHSTHAGVYGATTTNLGPNAAVLGYSSHTALTPNTTWGALGYVETSDGNNWAGYFSGNVYSSGNVGINKTSPSQRLDVVGRVRFNDPSYVDSRYIEIYSSGANYIDATNDLYIRPTGGIILQPGYNNTVEQGVQIKTRGGTQYGVFDGTTSRFGMIQEFSTPGSKLSIQGNASIGG